MTAVCPILKELCPNHPDNKEKIKHLKHEYCTFFIGDECLFMEFMDKFLYGSIFVDQV